MKRFLPFAALALAALPAHAFATTTVWDLDPAHTTAGFSVTHMMISTVRGEFGKTTGTVNLDDSDPTKSTVDVTIDASTIDTRTPDRDKHLKSPDFFSVDKFPTITFKSTKVEKNGANLKVTGDLTMRGVTKPVVLDVTGPSAAVKTPWGTQARGAHATGTLKRSDFGMVWNKALEAGGVVVSDEVALDLNVEINPHVDKKADAK